MSKDINILQMKRRRLEEELKILGKCIACNNNLVIKLKRCDTNAIYKTKEKKPTSQNIDKEYSWIVLGKNGVPKKGS